MRKSREVQRTTTVEILKRAKDLLQQGWTKNAYARDDFGYSVSETSEDAVCWCANGALWRAVWDLNATSAECQRYARRELDALTADGSIVRFNDKQTEGATVECEGEGSDWGFSDDYATAREAVKAEVPQTQNEFSGGLANFNDAQTTNEPVVALFDRAIAKLEAGQ